MAIFLAGFVFKSKVIFLKHYGPTEDKGRGSFRFQFSFQFFLFCTIHKNLHYICRSKL